MIRYVKTRIDVARFKLFVCHEVDKTVVFDVTGYDRGIVLRSVARYMTMNYPGIDYRIQRSNMRPGYAYVHFSQAV